MLSTLYSMGRLDVLASLRDHKLPPLAAWDAFRGGRLDQLATADSMVPFASAFARWRAGGNTRKGREYSKSRDASIRYTERQLLKYAQPGATIADVPAIVTALREASVNRQATFDRDRSAVLAFLRDTCKRTSALYKAVSAIEPFNRPRQRATHPLMVKDLVERTKALDSEVATCCWAMATTGMGPGEYWGEEGGPMPWERREHGIWILGAKKAGDGSARTRVVPDLGYCALRPQLSGEAFRLRLRSQSKRKFTPYDLRRTYANWRESAGIRRTRLKIYMGHSIADVADRYTWHDVTPHLQADQRILWTWMDTQSPDLPHASRMHLESRLLATI